MLRRLMIIVSTFFILQKKSDREYPKKSRFGYRNGLLHLTWVRKRLDLPSKVFIHRFNAIVDVQFFIDVVNVFANRFLGNTQLG